jgi:hypothetical protein
MGRARQHLSAGFKFFNWKFLSHIFFHFDVFLKVRRNVNHFFRGIFVLKSQSYMARVFKVDIVAWRDIRKSLQLRRAVSI